MCKKKVLELHTSCPLLEPIFLYIMGVPTGLFINVFSNEILNNSNVETWKWYKSLYGRISLALFIVVLLYYFFLSSYSIAKQLNKKIKKSDRYDESFYKAFDAVMVSQNYSFDRKFKFYKMVVDYNESNPEDRRI